jgi:hypothetical protein
MTITNLHFDIGFEALTAVTTNYLYLERSPTFRSNILLKSSGQKSKTKKKLVLKLQPASDGFLLGLLFDPENESDAPPKRQSPNYTL